MFWRRLAIIIILFFVAGPAVLAYSSPGRPAGFVNDYANLLDSGQKNSLEERLRQFEKDTSNQLVIVTIPSLGGDTIENFAVKLFEEWQIGQKDKDNGALLLVSAGDRQMRLEVGYGLEGALTDALSSQIIRNDLRPAFQSGDYYGGLDKAANNIIAATKGEYRPSDTDVSSTVRKSLLSGDNIFYLFFFVLYIISALRRYLAKSRNWWEGGAMGLAFGFIIALIFFRTLVFFLVLPVVLAVLGLIFDYLVSRVLPQPKASKNGGFWIFPGGFGGGGGGGFGGFGGGGSGGGGASGRW